MTRKTLVVATVLLAAPAESQDAFIPGTSPMDLAPQTQALTSSVIGNLSVGSATRARNSDGPKQIVPRRKAPARSATAGSNAPLPYVSTPASRKRALDAFLAKAFANDPASASKARAEYAGRNVEGELGAAMSKVGLRVNDAADVMATFLVIGWEVVHGGDATAAQVRGLRHQVAGRLIANPAFRDPAVRTQFAEELKLSAFTFGAGGAAAKRDGTMANYKRVIAGYYLRQTGIDLAAVRLTSGGFAF